MTSPFHNSYLQMPEHFFHQVSPDALSDATLIHVNQPLLDELALKLNHNTLKNMTSGQNFPAGMTPIAQKYTGHQFGYYNPSLGDGRGLLLGQVKDNKQGLWDLHLKGAGLTPYSRSGDGRAVLRSAIREYIIGEALHGLGIPTSRCLSICHSSEPVRRELIEDRSSYIRIAKTHIRFGHFEWLSELGDVDDFKTLADYVIQSVYPELTPLSPSERYSALLNKIISRTAVLMACWQASGFCHGVMNTDNMSVAGETFDFGPYAFLDDCQLHYICNHSDTEGRYAYSQQPSIGLWNCQVLGQAFSLILESEQIDEAMNLYVTHYNQNYLEKMRSKLGLIEPQPDDKYFIADTLLLLDQSELDFHYFFQLLIHASTNQQEQLINYLASSKTYSLESSSSEPNISQAWADWLIRYRNRIELDNNETERQVLIQNNTPKLVLRNYIAQEIIEAAETHNYQPLKQWMNWIQNPFELAQDFDPELHNYYLSPPETTTDKNIILSCSS